MQIESHSIQKYAHTHTQSHMYNVHIIELVRLGINLVLEDFVVVIVVTAVAMEYRKMLQNLVLCYEYGFYLAFNTKRLQLLRSIDGCITSNFITENVVKMYLCI